MDKISKRQNVERQNIEVVKFRTHNIEVVKYRTKKYRRGNILKDKYYVAKCQTQKYEKARQRTLKLKKSSIKMLPKYRDIVASHQTENEGLKVPKIKCRITSFFI